jgi:hypothetical protein
MRWKRLPAILFIDFGLATSFVVGIMFYIDIKLSSLRLGAIVACSELARRLVNRVAGRYSPFCLAKPSKVRIRLIAISFWVHFIVLGFSWVTLTRHAVDQLLEGGLGLWSVAFSLFPTMTAMYAAVLFASRLGQSHDHGAL